MRTLTIAIVLGSMAKLALAQSATPAVADGGEAPRPTAIPAAEVAPQAIPIPAVSVADADAPRPMPMPNEVVSVGQQAIPSPAAPAAYSSSGGSSSAGAKDDDGDRDGGWKPNKKKRRRPRGYTVGIGLGYNVPGADLKSPDVASVRLRLPAGLTIEPNVVMKSTTDRHDDGVVDANDSHTAFRFGANARLPVRMRGRVDLLAVGGFSYGMSTDNPEGPNNVVTAHTADLSWGVGIDYWVNRNWALSATATNPVLEYSKTRTEDIAGTTEDVHTSFGAIWDPNVTFMLHMFY